MYSIISLSILSIFRSILKSFRYPLLLLFLLIPLLIASCDPKKMAESNQKRMTESGMESAKRGYYTCSMHPQVISHEPGECPMCGMKLTYVETGLQEKLHSDEVHGEERSLMINGKSLQGTDPAGNSSGVSGRLRFSLSSTLLSNSEVATVAVKKAKFSKKTKYSAHIDYNEDPNRLVLVSTKYDGWVEKLFISKEGQYVRRGAKLAAIYSPEILTAKQEYITVFNTLKSLFELQNRTALQERAELPASKEKLSGQKEKLSGQEGKPSKDEVDRVRRALYNDPTIKATRQKLIYLDISAAQIANLERRGYPLRRNYLTSPISGVIVKKDVLQGSFIKAGQEILRVANLDRLWAIIHVFEKDIQLLKKGQRVILKSQAYPNQLLQGHIDLVYPFLDPKSKDIKVRIVINNHKGLLKPGMLAEAEIVQELKGEQLIVPNSAIIYSGEKSYLFVSIGDNSFELRPLEIQISSVSQAVVSKGLVEGEQIVINGQFLLDSEASLKEVLFKETMRHAGHQ